MGQEIIKSGEIPTLITFLEERKKKLSELHGTDSEIIYGLENRIAALNYILDKYIVNTVTAMMPNIAGKLLLEKGIPTQLQLNFYETKEVNEARKIKGELTGIVEEKEIEKKLWEIQGAQIALCKKVLEKFIEEHKELKNLNKNEILKLMWESTGKTDEERVDAFSKLRELAVMIYYNSSIIAAKKRIKSALPDWKDEEVTQFVAESVHINKLSKYELKGKGKGWLYDPTTGKDSKKEIIDSTIKNKPVIDFELQREVNVAKKKIAEEFKEKSQEAYKVTLRKTKDKKLATEEVRKIEKEALTQARKLALQEVNKFRAYFPKQSKKNESKAAA
jgi:hypothetical protein